MLLTFVLWLLISVTSVRSAPATNAKKADNSTITVLTPLGPAVGLRTSNGVARFVVKYASAKRFQPPTASTSWITGTDANSLPPMCVQPANGLDGGPVGVEDCLFMVIYVPLTSNVLTSGIPILTWVHGGSFVAGSASNPGLDGSAFAKATNTVVAVVQYRLGALGFLPPAEASANSNLGAKDVMTALKFISKIVTSFGGDKAHITLAGQSSGATLVRSLLAAPSASAYFQNAILHSDPMAYGFNTQSAQANLQTAFYSNTSCAVRDAACHNALSLDTIITVQNQIYLDAPSIDVTTQGNEPIRVVHDGSFVTSTMTGNSFPSSLKPIVVTTTNKDAGPAIYSFFSDPLPGFAWEPVLEGTFEGETTAILDSPFYPAPPEDSGDIRPQLVDLGTDQIWRCPTWTMSRAWAAKGGTVYTGVISEGSVYPDTVQYGVCSETYVCHEGDIEILFGTVPNPSAAQTKLSSEIQARWASFIKTSNPNPSGSSYAKWGKSTTTAVNALNLGGTGSIPDNGCEIGFFGSQVKYYWQLYGQ